MNVKPVAYSKGGYWMPSIPDQTCVQCGAIYTAHKYGQTHCSKKCAARTRAQKLAESHTARTCPNCAKEWKAAQSNRSAYCSRSCLYAHQEWIKERDADCAQCGTTFKSRFRRERNEWTAYCSSACAHAGARTRLDRDCAECGATFTPYHETQLTCSIGCRSAYFIRDRAPAWIGGLVKQNAREFRRIDREGYAAKYEGEHRLIAGRELGRPVARGEAILCIDGDNENLTPDNLFICPNMREMGLINAGTVEWPTTSNLQEYRVAGYVRPQVIMVLHEWEAGKRMGESGKMITRHPQADEIIKRRKAGASVRQLSIDFGTALSTMAQTIRTRL